MNIKRLLILLIVSMLCACSSTPKSINYYLLDGALDYSDTTSFQKPKHVVLLNKLTLTEYLLSANLPLIQDDHQVRYANHSAWAEPISQGISRALINDFSQLSPNQLVLNSMPDSAKADYQLQISIDHFSATDSGDVILVGNYWLNKNQNVISQQRFNFKQALDKDGFNQSVIQQRRLIKQLTSLIVSDPSLK